MNRFFRTDNSIAPLLLRLTLGGVFLPHGLQKTLGLFGGYGFAGTMEFFTATGMPAVLAVLVIAGESLGALGLITGTLTRLSAFGIGATMTGAIFMVHAKFGFFMNWFGTQQGEGFEYHLLALGIAIALLITGAGRWSVDGWIADKLEGHKGQEARS